jgi:integral membrane protein (TIGR01906 family)
LLKAGKEVRAYFSSTNDRLYIPIYVGSAEVELFTPVETRHMLDVKEIVQKLYRIQEGLLLFVLLFITCGFLMKGPEFATIIRRLIRYGSIGTILLMVLAGTSVTVAFGPLFTLFHKISFANDYWILDPKTSFLVRMFPLDFWFETTIFIAFLCVAEAILMIFITIFLEWWKRRKQMLADRRVTQYI